jgi:hypothetical protein
VKEASKLLGDVSLHTISDMRNAAESIYKLGPKYVFSISVNLFCFICSRTRERVSSLVVEGFRVAHLSPGFDSSRGQIFRLG